MMADTTSLFAGMARLLHLSLAKTVADRPTGQKGFRPFTISKRLMFTCCTGAIYCSPRADAGVEEPGGYKGKT